MFISYLRLLNFRGIYSGMGKTELVLKFPNPNSLSSKIILLMGGNGSGKSTVLSSLQPFASSFDGRDESLIRRGFNGEKEIHIIKGKDKYVIFHQYIKVGNTGKELASTSTKSFIMKNDKELNENGGVKTFKELIKQELGIEESFFKIGRIASTAVNFVDLPAGERKDFIIKQLPDTSEWLDAYENAKTKCTLTNKQITSLSLDLKSFEEEEIIKERFQSSEQSCKNKDKEITALERAKAVVDSKISDFESNSDNKDKIKKQEKYNALLEELDEFEKQIIAVRKSLGYDNPDDFEQFGSSELTEKVNELNLKVGKKEESISSAEEILNNLIESRNEYKTQIANARNQKNELLDFDENEQQLQAQLDKVNVEKGECIEIKNNALKKIKSTSEKDFSDALKAFQSYNTASPSNKRDNNFLSILNKINYISEQLNTYYSNPNGIVDYLNSHFNLLTITEEDISQKLNLTCEQLDKTEAKIKELTEKEFKLSNELDISSRLDQKVPKECSVEGCPFRRGLLTEEGKRVSTTKLDNCKKEIKKSKEEFETLIAQKDIENQVLELFKSIKNAYKQCTDAVVSNFVNKFYKIESLSSFINSLSGQPIYSARNIMVGVLDSIQDFFDAEDRIAIVNLKISTIDDKIKYLKNNKKTLDTIDSNIRNYIEKVASLDDDIDTKKGEIRTGRESLEKQKKTLSLLNKYLEYVQQYENNVEEIDKLSEDLKNFEKANEKYIAWKNESGDYATKLKELKDELEDLRDTNKELFTKLNKVREMKALKKDLEDKYEKEIVVRDTADPKKGFPLYYLRSFMQDIEGLSNKLFDIAFGKDRFYISFQIDEKVFKVNIYKADGDILEDAKLASDGERSLVKLIISLSLLSQYTREFPIMALDEVDSVLDDTYRSNFASIIEGQVKALGLSQVFIISHNENFRNSEIPVCLFPRNTFNKKVESNKILFDHSK